MRDGVFLALSLAPGIIPLGVLFGASAVTLGFDRTAAVALSALVFAGGAQFAALGLVASGAGVLAVTVLTAIVNARYFLLSAATLDLGRRAGAGMRTRIALAVGTVDESFALQSASAKRDGIHIVRLLAIPGTLWIIWVASTALGTVLGSALPDLTPYGLDYALPGIFVGLFGIFAETRTHLTVGLVALVTGGALALAGFGTIAVLLVPPILAFGFGRWLPRGE